MKRFLLAGCAAVFFFTGAAFASPAQDLFDQAGFYLGFNYNGFNSTDPEKLVDKYQAQLTQACQSKGETCDYGVAQTLIQAMLEELGDQHSYYVEPDEASGLGGSPIGGGSSDQETTMGFLPIPYSGADGVSLRVIEVLEGGAAEEAGLQRLDRIYKINDRAIPNSRDGIAQFYSAADSSASPVKLSIERAGKELEISVKPRNTDVRSLPFMNVVGGVARIVIPDFDSYNSVAPKLHQLVKKAQSLNARAIVVDLRDNGGGAATECLAGASAFAPDVSRIRETRRERRLDAYQNGRVFFKDLTTGKETEYYKIANPAKWTGKLAVLVNKQSASCAEYFASDIQYAKRGPVIGERTYGLGNTGALRFPLIDKGVLQVTVLKSFHADNSPYPERVAPDAFVRDNFDNVVLKGKDDVLERALQEVSGTAQ
jgi:carboxyl-terminal processing protease